MQSKGLSRIFSNITVQKYQFFISAFFTVQLSHPYVTTGKTIALTRRTFVGKVMSLLFNMLSRLVIAFLPRSKRLLISWLQSPAVVLKAPPSQIKSVAVSIVSPSVCHKVKVLRERKQENQPRVRFLIICLRFGNYSVFSGSENSLHAGEVGVGSLAGCIPVILGVCLTSSVTWEKLGGRNPHVWFVLQCFSS